MLEKFGFKKKLKVEDPEKVFSRFSDFLPYSCKLEQKDDPLANVLKERAKANLEEMLITFKELEETLTKKYGETWLMLTKMLSYIDFTLQLYEKRFRNSLTVTVWLSERSTKDNLDFVGRVVADYKDDIMEELNGVFVVFSAHLKPELTRLWAENSVGENMAVLVSSWEVRKSRAGNKYVKAFELFTDDDEKIMRMLTEKRKELSKLINKMEKENGV